MTHIANLILILGIIIGYFLGYQHGKFAERRKNR